MIFPPLKVFIYKTHMKQSSKPNIFRHSSVSSTYPCLFLADMLLHKAAGMVADMGAGMVADKVADMVVGIAADKTKI